jgi:hypothetical protein
MTEEKRAGKLALLMSISTDTIQMEFDNNTG